MDSRTPSAFVGGPVSAPGSPQTPGAQRLCGDSRSNGFKDLSPVSGIGGDGWCRCDGSWSLSHGCLSAPPLCPAASPRVTACCDCGWGRGLRGLGFRGVLQPGHRGQPACSWTCVSICMHADTAQPHLGTCMRTLTLDIERSRPDRTGGGHLNRGSTLDTGQRSRHASRLPPLRHPSSAPLRQTRVVVSLEDILYT